MRLSYLVSKNSTGADVQLLLDQEIVPIPTVGTISDPRLVVSLKGLPEKRDLASGCTAI